MKSDHHHSHIYNQKHKHKPRKRFGQNFLKDEQVIERIITSLNLQPHDRVIEIGPGLGALTKPLLEYHDIQLEVIELDRDLVKKLQKLQHSDGTEGLDQKFIIHEGDALKFDYATLMNSQGRDNPKKKLRLIGNLPYNISTPLIFHLLKYCPIIQDMHFMLQQELVDRISAHPNQKSYGKLSVMLQYACQAQALFSVAKEAFSPVPKVQSAIIRLIPYETPPYPARNLERLREMTKTAFMQRRKTLMNALKNYLNKEDFVALNIEPGLRPEQLSVEEFVRIANFLEDKLKGDQETSETAKRDD